jgi:hypothetical protein
MVNDIGGAVRRDTSDICVSSDDVMSAPLVVAGSLVGELQRLHRLHRDFLSAHTSIH